jgi:hypothetical protein
MTFSRGANFVENLAKCDDGKLRIVDQASQGRGDGCDLQNLAKAAIQALVAGG